MLVVVPSYKRLPLLRWSLASVIRAGRDLTGPKRLLIVANHPPLNDEARRVLDKVLKEEDGSGSWETIFLGREQSIDPVDSWYGAIMEYARQGEVVFLHGDDDLLMPGGLASRQAALDAVDAPVLVSRHRGPLVFRGDEECFPPDLSPPGPAPPATALGFGDGMLGYAPFIGNLAYRFNGEFRRLFEICSQDCDAQTWLPRKERTLMLPYYLPMVALREGMQVAGLDHPCVIRGNGYEELVGHPYQCASWNNGFLYGATLDFLSTGACGACPGLDGDRALYRELTARTYFSVLADKRIPATMKREWITRTKPRVKALCKDRYRGMLPVLGEWTGLTKVRLRVSFGLRSAVPVREGVLDRMFP